MTAGVRIISPSDGSFYSYRKWSGMNGVAGQHDSLHPNPYQVDYNSFSRTKSRRLVKHPVTGVWTCWPGTESYMLSCSGHGSVPWEPNDDIALLGKLSKKARGTSFNAGVFLAQGGQAVSQAVSTITAFGLAAAALRKGDLPRALKAIGLSPGQRKVSEINRRLNTGDISGALLAMQYGWLPTLSDIHEAWKTYEARTSGPRRMAISATLSRSTTFEGSASPGNYSCPGVASRSKRITFYQTEILPESRSLGLEDPASVLWEALPWSFVVDWFLPIGAYLEALNIVPQLKGSGIMGDRTKSFTSLGRAVTPAYSCGGSSSTTRGAFSRTLLADGLAVPLPSFKSLPAAMSPSRIYNAVALAHQKFR